MLTLRAFDYLSHQPIEISIAGGILRAIHPLTVGEPTRQALPTIAPGLIDLQINGYLGEDFNASPPVPGALGRATRAMWAQGVTAFYPTVITHSTDSIQAALRAIADACESDADVAAAVAGIHLEGPFISPEDGARGAHARQYVLAPDFELLQCWQDAAGGRIRILTMSPEWPGAMKFIEQCAAAGITVSIGHTAATPAQIADSVAAGARMITHFGNGAHLMLPRHPNYLWEQLAQDELRACLIADGFHLPDQVIKVAMRVKGERAMIVSDAVALAGMPPGSYTMPVGGGVVLTAEGRLHLAENEKLLAGSAQMLPWGIAHLLRRNLATFAEAWQMASTRPAKFMNLPQSAGLKVGAPADLVMFSLDDNRVMIEKTIKSGRVVYAAPRVN